MKNPFRRSVTVPPFDIEKAVGHYLLTLPRCTARVAVISRRFLDKRYNYELTVDTASLAAWAERHAKGVWSSNEPEQAARLTIPLWLRLADLSDDTVTLPPKEFFDVWHEYHDIFHDMPNSQLFCNGCGKVVNEVNKTETQLPRREIFDVRQYEWHCPQGHLLYQEEIGRHADSRNFSNEHNAELGLDIPVFLRNKS